MKTWFANAHINYTVQETTSHVHVSKKNDTTYLNKYDLKKKCYRSYSNRILGEILTPPPPLPKKTKTTYHLQMPTMLLPSDLHHHRSFSKKKNTLVGIFEKKYIKVYGNGKYAKINPLTLLFFLNKQISKMTELSLKKTAYFEKKFMFEV